MDDINYSLVANCIAIVVLILKSLFDLRINRWIFDVQIRRGADKLDALQQRNIRGSRTSAIAFAAMSLSLAFSIGGAMEDDRNRPDTRNSASLEQALSEHGARLKKIEDVLWPPTEGGDYGSPVPSGPRGPSGFEASLAEIKNMLADLTAKGTVTEERLERLIVIVNELERSVQEMKAAPSINSLQL